MSDQLKELMRGHEDKYPQQLVKQFPRIVNQIISLWNTPDEMTAYFEKLLVTDRQRSRRQGFPKIVAVELLTLSRIYDEIHHLERKVLEGELNELNDSLHKTGI